MTVRSCKTNVSAYLPSGETGRFVCHFRTGPRLETLGRPEDVAETLRFLCSEEARFITGQVIGVNGGMVI